jgi:dTDP-4-dehydrorhamnose 3,5-epimerase
MAAAGSSNSFARGPHEHVEQSDYFCFIGPGTFRVYLWDARPDSPTFGVKEVRDVGEDSPYALIVPPRIVHAYKNVSSKDGLVFNAANQLYAGWLKQDVVDEIRHEADANSLYKLD